MRHKNRKWGNRKRGLAFGLHSLSTVSMSRPLLLEFPGAIYHMTSRGDRREAMYADDEDRTAFVSIHGQAADRFDAQLLVEIGTTFSCYATG